MPRLTPHVSWLALVAVISVVAGAYVCYPSPAVPAAVSGALLLGPFATMLLTGTTPATGADWLIKGVGVVVTGVLWSTVFTVGWAIVQALWRDIQRGVRWWQERQR